MVVEWLVLEYERYGDAPVRSALVETPAVIYGWTDLEWPGSAGERVLRGPGHRYAVMTDDHRVLIFPNKYEVERGWADMLAARSKELTWTSR